MAVETLEETIEATKDLSQTNQEGSTVSCGCGCCADCNPEVVPVTINDNAIYLDENALELSFTGTGHSARNLVVQVVDEDGTDVAIQARVVIWFVDTADKAANPTPIPPASPGVSRLEAVTDEDGQLLLYCQNPVLTTWYVCASLGAAIYISEALTIGV